MRNDKISSAILELLHLKIKFCATFRNLFSTRKVSLFISKWSWLWQLWWSLGFLLWTRRKELLLKWCRNITICISLQAWFHLSDWHGLKEIVTIPTVRQPVHGIKFPTSFEFHTFFSVLFLLFLTQYWKKSDCQGLETYSAHLKKTNAVICSQQVEWKSNEYALEYLVSPHFWEKCWNLM